MVPLGLFPLDVLIDDRLDNLVGHRGIVFDMPWNRDGKLADYWPSAHSWEEVIRWVRGMER